MILGKIRVQNEKNILAVRNVSKVVSRVMGFERLDGIRIATAASELTRNLYEHAKGGEISFEVLEKAGKMGLQLVFKDKGGGIKDIDEVLSEKYQSPVGMGIGLKGANKLMDEFAIDTRVGKGTTVTIVKWLDVGTVLSQDVIERITQDFAALSEESALESLKTQNRELIEVLNEVKAKNTRIEEVNRELESTNAGILSLYKEIDIKNEELNLKNKRKSKFLRGFGHETRTPLTSILSLSSLLEKRTDGELTPPSRRSR